MPRAIWTGAISFGMVSIPVKLYTATQSKDVSFRQLHREDLSRIQQRRWCMAEDREVGYDELVRGYEYAKDQYVVLGDEDFEQLPVPSQHTIELSAFVNTDEIDPIYYEKSYYLEPDEAGVKPFALLIRALEEKGLVAVAKIALRNKEHLCVLRQYGNGIVLETLFYPDEVRVEPEADLSKVKVSDQELRMALSLIEMLEQPFQPEQYEDEYRQALMEMITAKLEGGEVVAAEQPVTEAKPVDLMAALRASLDAAKARRGEAAGGNGAKEPEEEPAEAEPEEAKPRRRKSSGGTRRKSS
jgi:DNA end-binding protein Ku